MLNRRTIRIKAMQSLFAFEQCKQSNYHIALDFINENFLPDLNSMEVQDKPLLKARGKEATLLFKQYYKDSKSKISTGSAPQINEMVQGAIKTYHKQLANDKKQLKRLMLKDADSIYKQYASLLILPVELAALANLEKEKKDQSSWSNFVQNSFVEKIKQNKALEQTYLKSGFSWENEVDELRLWLREALLKDETFVDYLQLQSPDFESDKEIIVYLSKSLIFKNKDINQFMENKDLYWSENKTILKSMIGKTLKNILPDSPADFELAELSYNWEDDKEFFEFIFDKTLEEEEKYEELIAQKTKNWDID